MVKFTKPEIFENGDTIKQMMARSRFALYKSRDKWTECTEGTEPSIIFERYPDIERVLINYQTD